MVREIWRLCLEKPSLLEGAVLENAVIPHPKFLDDSGYQQQRLVVSEEGNVQEVSIGTADLLGSDPTFMEVPMSMWHEDALVGCDFSRGTQPGCVLLHVIDCPGSCRVFPWTKHSLQRIISYPHCRCHRPNTPCHRVCTRNARIWAILMNAGRVNRAVGQVHVNRTPESGGGEQNSQSARERRGTRRG